MPRHRASRRKKTGLSPGTPIYIGEARSHAVAVRVLDYDHDTLREGRGLEAARPPGAKASEVRWVDVDGVHDVGLITAIGGAFGLHPLLQEDVSNVASRTKLEEYESCLFLVFKAFQVEENHEGFRVVPEQISLVLGRGWLITFQELPGDTFDGVRRRVRDGRGRIRTMRADYLAYSVLDATVDRYFEVLERVAAAVDDLEREVLLEEPEQVRDLPGRIHRLRQELQVMRKHVLPLATALGTLQRGQSPLFQGETLVFLRDVADHVAQVLDQLENLRDALVGLLDTQIALSNQKIGEVTKVLTVVTAIFIPLTFIVGVYGMNFEHMPELRWRYGYFGVLALMASIVIGLVAYFRHRRWLG